VYSHNFIWPEQFSFTNKNGRICQEENLLINSFMLHFLSLKNPMIKVNILNIFTKIYKIGICGRYFHFLSNLYLIFKIQTYLFDMFISYVWYRDSYSIFAHKPLINDYESKFIQILFNKSFILFYYNKKK